MSVLQREIAEHYHYCTCVLGFFSNNGLVLGHWLLGHYMIHITFDLNLIEIIVFLLMH